MEMVEENLDLYALDVLSLSSLENINWSLYGPGLIEETNQEDSNQEIFMDLSSMFVLSQKEAANRLGMAPSTLSRRWKQVDTEFRIFLNIQATKNKKWPNRVLTKLDKRIESLVRNLLRDGNGNLLPNESEQRELFHLNEKRKEISLPVFISIKVDRRKK